MNDNGEKRYYLACLDLNGRSCLVVGGGRVGLEKAKGLLECGAVVTVIAPQIEPELEQLPVHIRRKRYETGDLDGHFLAVAATPVRSVNHRIFRDAEERSMLANVVDTPDLCSFILPAVYRRDPIALAVSTGGASPALAKRLRDELGAHIGDEHVALARRLRDLRPWARRHYHSYVARRDYFEAIVEESLR
jgi:precorrin-2 dehydrogenase / sirohydrochlorin ferrochelatase